MVQVSRLDHLSVGQSVCLSAKWLTGSDGPIEIPFSMVSGLLSWVISGTSVTVESGQRFLHGFVIFEGSFKKLAGITLAKVWANLARGQNSKWLPAAILEITFSIISHCVCIQSCCWSARFHVCRQRAYS